MTHPNLIILPEQLDLQLQDIANKSEIEECALMFGIDSVDSVIVEKYIQLYNIDQSPVSFEMESGELVKAMIEGSQCGELIGVWHSHPRGLPYPSSKDFEFMNNLNVVWTIYAKKQEVSQSFVRENNQVIRIRQN